jgi:hypothetical protein
VVPGFFEIDTVSHSSSNPNGPFLDSLNMTDIATCWTVPFALRSKSALEVIRAIEKSRRHIPFPILGLDFDNGSEFLNEALISWADDRQITYTRSRSYKKNDQAWIEEKNGSVVRKNVGRERYAAETAFVALSELYDTLRLYFNFFQPCQKLLDKKRDGAKVCKRYDLSRTPYRRVLESPHISECVKQNLRIQRESLDMFALHESLDTLRARLKEFAEDVPNPVLTVAMMQRNATHDFVNRLQVRQETQTRTFGLMARVRETLAEIPTGTLVKARELTHLGDVKRITSCLHHLAKKGLLHSQSWGVYEKLDWRCEKIKSLDALISEVLAEQEQRRPFTWRDFSHLGEQMKINSSLSRLAQKGIISRVQFGVYVRTEKPQKQIPQKIVRPGTNYFEATVSTGTILK